MLRQRAGRTFEPEADGAPQRPIHAAGAIVVLGSAAVPAGIAIGSGRNLDFLGPFYRTAEAALPPPSSVILIDALTRQFRSIPITLGGEKIITP